ncbi:MAG: MMPL family transporter, partial [Chloroflexota bacterium]|nr:MMPL family transporter [Chloroflexota bacterium]
MTDPFARFGAALVRFRWLVLLGWLVVLGVAAGLLAPKASEVVKGGGFQDDNSESIKAARVLADEFNAAPGNTVIIVYRSPDRTVDDPTYRDAVTRGAEALQTVHGVRAVLTFFNTGDPSFNSQDRRTTLGLVSIEGDKGDAQETVPDLRERLDALQLPIEHYATGFPAIDYDTFVTSEEDLRRSEVFTIPIILILLLLVFRTVIASAIPMVLGAFSVLLAIAAIYLIGSAIDTSIFALNVASMIGLGLSIDFSLIMISRFREERAAGRDTRDAVAITLATAGRSIFYSGVTVLLAMGVLTLLLARLMIVRSISLAVMVVAFTSLLAGLTLLPAILGILGHRIEWLRVMPRPKPPQPGQTGFWYRFSHAIMRRPWLWFLGSLAVLLAMAIPVKDISLVGGTTGALPSEVEAVRGFEAMNESFGANRLTPIQIVITTPEEGGVFRPDFLDGVRRLSEAAAADPRNEEVRSLAILARLAGLTPEQYRQLTPDAVRADPQRAQATAQFVNLNGGNDATTITVFSRYDQYDERHQQFVYDLRDTLIPEIGQLRGANVSVGGSAAEFLDLQRGLYGRFPLVAAAVMFLIFVILMMFFQSVFLPLKAIFLNAVSILATYGVLVVIFGYGVGTGLLGFESQDALGVVTPVILFVILFALSTDYEVFLLSRVKEYYHEIKNNEEAVATGLEQTAGLITAAGLILIGTFGSFASARVVSIKEIGLGLAIGVLLDSTIVRVIMVPATMRLAGDFNWWMPTWLKRIVPE